MFNSFVLLRGVHKPLLISFKAATDIKKIFDDSNIEGSFVITVGKNSFRKAEIKYLEIIKDGAGYESFEAESRKFYEEEKASYAALAKKDVNYKAKILEPFKIMYRISTGDEPSEEKLKEAYNIQMRFFTANPRRTSCDPILFKSIVPVVKQKRITPFENAYFDILGRKADRDHKLSK